jgi:hypothetical protein
MDIKSLADQYEASTRYAADIISALSDSDLDKSVGDGWTPRQVVHHLADSEAQSYARIRRLLAEPEGSVIQGYDEGAWANCPTLGYTQLSIENSFAVYLSVRAASLDVLGRMQLSDLEKFGMHSESGKYTVTDWLKVYSSHPRDHGDQIKGALGL